MRHLAHSLCMLKHETAVPHRGWGIFKQCITPERGIKMYKVKQKINLTRTLLYDTVGTETGRGQTSPRNLYVT